MPSIPSEGRGKANLYSRDDIVKLYIFKNLLENGISRFMASYICRNRIGQQGNDDTFIFVNWNKAEKTIDRNVYPE